MRRGIDLERVFQQNMWENIPPDHKDKTHVEREQDQVSALLPELKAERNKIIDRFVRVERIHERWPDVNPEGEINIGNAEYKKALIKELRKC